MTEENTCGTGMAASAILPTRMASMLTAQAEMLARHTDSLDRDEHAGVAEREAWLAIAEEQRRAADRLTAVAELMAAQRNLPMAEHDMAAMGAQGVAFERLVEEQQALADLLAEQLREFRAMLDG